MMLLEMLLFSIVGIVIGILLGLLPGMHINNVLPLFLASAVLIQNPYYLAAFIISAAISQIFISYIPSIFLGAPEADTSLSVLPGHKLLLEGRGYEAIRLTVIGGLISLILSIGFILAFGNYFAIVYDFIRPHLGYALLAVLGFMILSERKPVKIVSSLLIVLLSGFLGILVLNSHIVPPQNVLFPTFAGLFAISTLLIAVNQNTKIPKQQFDSKINEPRINIVKSIIFGVIAGVLVGLLPAIGVSQAATFMQYFGGLGEARTFLVTLSGINTANEVVSLNSLYLISNPRSGASVAIERILPDIAFNDMLLFLGVILFSAGVSVPVVLYLGKLIPKFLVKLNYTILSYSVVGFLTIMITAITGPYGLLIGLTATGIGLLCVYLDVNRSNCMAVLLVPSILFFSGLNPLIFTLLNI